MWFGPGVQVVAHVPVAGPKKNKVILLVTEKFAFCSLVFKLLSSKLFTFFCALLENLLHRDDSRLSFKSHFT